MRWACILAVAAVAIPAVARGQDPFFQPQFLDAGSGAQFIVAPPDAPRAGRDPRDGPARTAGLRGTVGGLGQNNHANAAAGFLFLTPLWSFRDFQLAAPKGFEDAFPGFGGGGPVHSRFALVPRVNLDYYVEDLDVAVGGSGTFVNLSGRVDRQAAGTHGPTGVLTASANLTLVSANVVEFGRQFAFLELFPDKTRAKPAVVDSIVELRVGTRFVSVEQNYTGSLQGTRPEVVGTALTSRFSSQSFRGLGLTAASEWTLPVWTDFGLFASTRGSLLLGENRRNSTVSVTIPGHPGVTNTRLDNRTVLVPVTELEMGIMYGADLGDRIREGLPPPRFLLKVAAVGQYWGGLGPLSAGSTQEFRNTDLFLVGGYVQAGFRY